MATTYTQEFYKKIRFSKKTPSPCLKRGDWFIYTAYMFTRILFVTLIFLCCGIQTASAGVITSLDSNIDQESIVCCDEMSTTDDYEAPVLLSAQEELGMSALTSQSSTSSQTAISSVEHELVFYPVLTGSRLRFANASLPSSPELDGLLKPS